MLFKRSGDLGTRERGRERILTKGDTLIDVGGFKITLGKRTDDKNDRLIGGRERRHKIRQRDELGGMRRCGNASRTRRQVRLDRILDDTHENIVRFVGSDDFEVAEELNHDAGKAFECAGNASVRIHFNEHIAMCVNENLQQTSFAKWRIEKIQSENQKKKKHY